MKRSINIFALTLIALFTTTEAFSQIVKPRLDDHFQRELVVNRIDLTEKMNEPIVSPSDPAYYTNASEPGYQGMVHALFEGLKSGKYLAYDAESLNKSLTWEEVQAHVNKLNGTEEYEEWGEDEDCEFCDDIEDEEYISSDSETSAYYLNGTSGSGMDEDASMDLAAMETTIEFIENRIFDKNRSAQIHDIQYIRIVWVDPAESLPDQNVICIKYEDARETLENCQWTNRFNEAEHRNLVEVFDQRMFNSFATIISGRGIRTLDESAFRQNELLAFEQQLWSY